MSKLAPRPPSPVMTRPSNLLQGTLDLLILRTIQLEAMHGWAIAQQIRLMSRDQLRV